MLHAHDFWNYKILELRLIKHVICIWCSSPDQASPPITSKARVKGVNHKFATTYVMLSMVGWESSTQMCIFLSSLYWSTINFQLKFPRPAPLCKNKTWCGSTLLVLSYMQQVAQLIRIWLVGGREGGRDWVRVCARIQLCIANPNTTKQ